jgi:hypothetical protein
MGIFDFLHPSSSPEARATARLTEIAGRVEALADRLRRHADRCTMATMRIAVAEVADSQDGHLKVMKTILADAGAWPRPPAPPAHEGLSNWERLSSDLIELNEITAETSRTVMAWEHVDPRTAETLSTIAAEDSHASEKLRRQALLCDTLAID